MISDTQAVFGNDLPEKWEIQKVSEWLLMLAALLLPLDVAVRRLQLPEMWWARLGSRTKTMRASDSKAAEKETVWTRIEQKRAKTRKQTREHPGEGMWQHAVASEEQSEASKPQSGHAQAGPRQPVPPPAQAKQDEDEQAKKPDETLNRLLAAKKRRGK